MSRMPSNDDTKHQIEEATKGRTPVDASLASDLPYAHPPGADQAGIITASAAPLSSDHSMPREFTFFQKKKRRDQESLASSLAYASTAQVTAFAARLDSAMAVNAKTQRHLAELRKLMSDVALTMTVDVSKPTCKRLRRSKRLFYGCLVGVGAGWFLLFPSGHNLITQLTAYLVR